MSAGSQTCAPAATSPDALHGAGEHFAAGHMSCPDESAVVRFAHGIHAFLSQCPLPAYRGEALYPCGPSIYLRGHAVEWHYSACMTYNEAALRAKLEAAEDPSVRSALEAVHECLKDYPSVGGYTHSIPNYRRILREGLASYGPRIESRLAIAERRGETERVDFCRAMRIVLDAVRVLHSRSLTAIEAFAPETGTEGAAQAALADAFRTVPSAPARSFYQAFVCVNFILYLDGPDDLGRLDQDLWPYFQRDRAAGALGEAEVLEWLRRLWRNVDESVAWNVALGGLLEDGRSGINDLSRLCVRAAHGMRRPNLALRLHRQAPEWIWDEALDCIASGNGLPALYNEEAYLEGVRGAHLGVSEEDLPDFAFGGCTELMIHGKSNCGSLEGDINLPWVLVQTLDEHLTSSPTFEDLLAAYEHDLAKTIRDLTAAWDANQESKAHYQPQVIRSLLIDDCIANAREYNAGGAKYNWCVVNVMGLANVIDSLAAVRQAVYERGDVPAEVLLEALKLDFVGHEPLRQRLQTCPRFGNDDPRADDLAERVSGYVFSELRRYSPWRGGRYVPACLMFVTYAFFGLPVGATPDGRRAGQPIADSAGAMQGRDGSGPTAMIRSVTRIRHHLAPGTLVVNARFARRFFTDDDSRAKLKQLIRTYFELGGMQIQVNVVDQAMLEEAVDHPERYGDLIIRVGGYSEYWRFLDDALRRSILERTEHS